MIGSNYPFDAQRVNKYNLYEDIFLGKHSDAFSRHFKNFAKDYENIRYVTVNFGGLISKLSSDMLFEEFPTITLENDKNDFIKNVFFANKLKTQIYESGLETSYRGDGLFRIRAKEDELVIEDINPAIWHVVADSDNMRKEPKQHVLGWKVRLAGSEGKEGVFFEIHEKGRILHELYRLEHGKLTAKLDVTEWMPDVKEEEETGINDFLIVPIKNYGINSKRYGISDYNDIIDLMFAVGNRLSRTDNILDKHGDPVLAVPSGVLDEEGNLKKEAWGVIEVDTTDVSGGQMPQYIVWDAKLESAFTEIDRLVDFLWLTSETSPALFGMDSGGQAESGRALKFKMLRTLAKKHRKQLYYDDAIKSTLYTAQKFAKANGLTVNGEKVTQEPQIPMIEWQDGIINDIVEVIEVEERKLDSGLTTRKDAVMRIEGKSEDEAQKLIDEVDEEKKKNRPQFTANPLLGNPQDNTE